MKAIVHIGTEKTGTTSIQKYLFQNRKKLKAAGFHFLQCAGSLNNRALPAYFVTDHRADEFYRDEGITTPEGQEEFRRDFLQRFEHEISTLPQGIHTVVISSEHFHSRVRTTGELDKVHAFLTTYFDDIKIICYVRDQVSTCCSYYSTGLKSGTPATFAEFFRRCHPDNYYFNYYEMLSNWERCFGFKSLDVSLFSRKTFLNNNLLDDFTAKLDRSLIGSLNREIEIENESLTPVGQAMARGLNLAFPIRTSPPEVARIRDKCKSSIYEKYRGTGRFPSLKVQQRIYSDFTESNELLRQKFFPQMTLVFEPPVSEPVPQADIDEHFMEGVTSLWIELRKHGKDIIPKDQYAAIIKNFLTGILDVFSNEDELDAEIPAQASPKKNVKAVISRKDQRLLLFAANSLESKDLAMARDLLTLVQKLNPAGPGVAAKLDAIRKKELLSGQSKYAITYVGAVESSDPQERQVQMDNFYAWITSFSDCIDGGEINVLKDTYSLTQQSSGIARSAAISAGYTIVRVDSPEKAYEIASRCPHLTYGGSVFVSEVLHITPQS